MIASKYLIGIGIGVFLFGSVKAQENYKDKDTELVFKNKQVHEVLQVNVDEVKFKKKPKNIVLLIGDGMGVDHIFAGITANKGQLNLQNFKSIGFSKTQSADDYVTDSAAGGTALACGKKTSNGSIGVDENGNTLKSILEIADANGLATGLVSTSAITHATPASFIAHQPKRSMYEEIAADFLKTDIDVFIGGGNSFFTDRKDKRNLVSELKEKGYQMYTDLDAAANVNEGHLGVLTAPEHNPEYTQRGDMLLKASDKALEILSKDKDGFFLMIEGSQIDWGAHQNNVSFLTGEVLDFDTVIGEVLKFALEDKETLVIVTADHETGGFAVVGGDINKGKVEGGFVTGHHTGCMVPVFAVGPGASEFGGIYENTEVFNKMLKLYGFTK
ncbi:alkaline phosphatase [Plebeiibacterium sediminum]|uniref:Alkaline phosphatase n=1 Tax=Plebeiibacterium sediminum TaxID=2992112 RepID=A0AAE3SEY9_9BACT|nr:alkaline phosphatase [Plebeiobacterium sediminum]MCW3786706.1 alkaline phosphatase [Plebeiobacterium sediminum]